jgi:hypothetical protein
MLRGKVKLKILPHLNMSLRIGDIQKVRAILFVKMLTLNLQRLSKSIPTKEAADLSSLRHHRSHQTQMSTSPGSEVEGSEGAANKSYIKHSTSYDTSGSTASAAVCSCLSEWQIKEEQIKVLQEKAAEAY